MPCRLSHFFHQCKLVKLIDYGISFEFSEVTEEGESRGFIHKILELYISRLLLGLLSGFFHTVIHCLFQARYFHRKILKIFIIHIYILYINIS